jgi:integrase
MSASNGTYYPRKLKKGFAVYLQFVRDGKRITERVHEAAYGKLGVRSDMAYPEVQAALKRTNQLNTVEHRQHVRAARKAEETFETDTLYFPEEMVNGFLERLEEQNFGSEKHLSKLKSHFRFIQKMIIKLKISPNDYADRSSAFYKYFLNEAVSLEYANRLLRILNMWGQYCSKRANSFFEEAAYIKQGQVAAQITSVQSKKKQNVRRAATPLTKSNLEVLMNKADIPTESKNYFFVTLWLGLRPSEVKAALKDSKVFKVEFDKENKIDVFQFYQAKLSTKAESDRWKLIPLIYEEQKTAAQLLAQGSVHVPHSKTIANYLGDGFDQYSGRKGFADLMLDLGENVIHISSWLGHTNIKTTMDHYKDKKRVMYKKPS